MDSFRESIKKNRKTIIILSLIFLVGIFLRTYKFHDWLRFGHDQARDAWILSSALKGKDLPLLGPNAGVTAFQLGPAYYYFSYASEKIFGNYPDRMAYPSLFFSILSLPLLFLFLREYFGQKISLAMTAIASVSYFLVINSRFSSNPNLITFFVLLYLFSLLKILNGQENRYFLWSILAGISLGVGIQLHTTLLIAMPVTMTYALGYLFFKKRPVCFGKILLVIFAVFLIVNASQIYHEFKSNGSNIKRFFKGFDSSSGENNYGEKIFFIASCQIQANSHIVSSFRDDDRCSTIFDLFGKDVLTTFGLTISTVFSLIGYFLLFRNWRREKEEKKKNFLGLVIIFNVISFLILVPIANIIYVGYFINLFFLPFVLLGLIVQYLRKKYDQPGKVAAWAIIVILIFCGLNRDIAKAKSYREGLENNAENSTLSQTEQMSRFILEHSQNDQKIYFSGEDPLIGRFYYPIEYFVRESGKKIEKISQDSLDRAKLEPETYVYFVEQNKKEEIAPGEMRAGLEITDGQKFESQTILILKHK